MNKRDYSFDNVKFLLIFLVVFGHILEIAGKFGSECALYKVIYSFHIPVLVFINGYFAKFNKRKIAIFFIIYLIFQTLYICFNKFVLNEKLSFQYVKPNWIMWFLLVYIMYLLIIPLIDIDYAKYKKKYCNFKMIFIFVLSLIICIFIPYLKVVGKLFSLGRFFAFFPYFLLGYYIRKMVNYNGGFLFKLSKNKRIFTKMLFLVLAIFSIYLVISFKNINSFVYYGSKNYHLVEYYTPLTKLFTLFCGFSFIGFFVYTLRFNSRISLISFIGKNTLVIYLLHGFLVKPLKYVTLITSSNSNLVLLIFTALIIVFFLGNPLFEYLSKEFIYGKAYNRWIDKVKEKTTKKEDC